MSANPAPSEQSALTAQIIETVRRFVEREVMPVASEFEHATSIRTRSSSA